MIVFVTFLRRNGKSGSAKNVYILILKKRNVDPDLIDDVNDHTTGLDPRIFFLWKNLILFPGCREVVDMLREAQEQLRNSRKRTYPGTVKTVNFIRNLI
jgi:hypothetical protein